MLPTLNDGDDVLLKCYARFRRPQPGDVTCIRRGDGPMLFKRLGARDGNVRFSLAGDSVASAPAIDLRHASECEIVGPAILPLSASHIRLIISLMSRLK